MSHAEGVSAATASTTQTEARTILRQSTLTYGRDTKSSPKVIPLMDGDGVAQFRRDVGGCIGRTVAVVADGSARRGRNAVFCIRCGGRRRLKYTVRVGIKLLLELLIKLFS